MPPNFQNGNKIKELLFRGKGSQASFVKTNDGMKKWLKKYMLVFNNTIPVDMQSLVQEGFIIL